MDPDGLEAATGTIAAGGLKGTLSAAASTSPVALGAAGLVGGIILTLGMPSNLADGTLPPALINELDDAADDCGEREEVCLERYESDIASCRAIGRTRGKAAAVRCYKTAADRYAACLSGKPLPPLDVWNN